MNKIILTAEADLQDKEVREWISKLWKKVDSLNNRSKKHTLEIKSLERINRELMVEILKLKKVAK